MLASDKGRIAGRPGHRWKRTPSTFISTRVSPGDQWQRRKVFDETTASAASAEDGTRLDRHVGRCRRQLRPDRGLSGDLLDDLGHERALGLSLPMFGPHVGPVHVRTGQVQLESVRPCRAPGRPWPASASGRAPCRCGAAMMEAIRTRSGKAFLMRAMRGSHQSSGFSRSAPSSEECRTPERPLFIGERAAVAVHPQELRLRPRNVTTGACRSSW